MLEYSRAAGPIVLAHRGGSALALENSPSAFSNCASLGVTHIETDVRATADGVAVVIHDATLQRTTGGSGPVAGHSWRSLQQVRLRNGDTLLSLFEALTIFPSLTWNVDIKCDDAVIPFLAAVGQAAAWDRVCAASFSGRRMALVRRLVGPRLATSATPLEVAMVRLTGTTGARSPAPVAVQVPVRLHRVRVVTPRFIAAAHRCGLAVHVWTINDHKTMGSLLAMGVDGLVSDEPALALRAVAESGSR
jgi:glycerophosphoryl diester phosphodiesterase